MTLRCECGGALRAVDVTDPEKDVERWSERYECQACGRSGGGSFPADGRGSADYWGCVDDE